LKQNNTILSIYSDNQFCHVAVLRRGAGLTKSGKEGPVGDMGYGVASLKSIDLRLEKEAGNNNVSQATVLVPLIESAIADLIRTDSNEAFVPEYLIAPRGPGSFTSLRVLLAAAQGLQIAWPTAQVFSPTHFDVLGFHAHLNNYNKVCALINSRRGDWYAKFYDYTYYCSRADYSGAPGETSKGLDVKTISQGDLIDFINSHPDYKFIADGDNDLEDLSENADIKGRLITNNDCHVCDNFALSQARLLLHKESGGVGLNPEESSFKPFYFYQPEYVKSKNFI